MEISIQFVCIFHSVLRECAFVYMITVLTTHPPPHQKKDTITGFDVLLMKQSMQ